MVGKPAQPSSASGSQTDERAATGESSPPRERVGPVAIERLSKDDGRALILYSLSSHAAVAPESGRRA
jgi:hypothetical protein